MKASKRKNQPKAGPKQNQPKQDRSATNYESARNVLFEATIHPRRKNLNIDQIPKLDIDRVPDPKGEIRALLSADDCVRLLELGFEVRLVQVHEIRPFDRSLIETDESVRRWLKEKMGKLIPPNKELKI